VHAGDGVLAYAREAERERLPVALNLTARPRTIGLAGRLWLSTRLDREDERLSSELRLCGDEGVVLELDGRG
jgi:hypothetical protein